MFLEFTDLRDWNGVGQTRCVDVSNDRVRLKKKDGDIVTVPRDKLSPENRSQAFFISIFLSSPEAVAPMPETKPKVEEQAQPPVPRTPHPEATAATEKREGQSPQAPSGQTPHASLHREAAEQASKAQINDPTFRKTEEALKKSPERSKAWHELTSLHTWRDVTGAFTVNARFISRDTNPESQAVHLETGDGKHFAIWFDQLSDNDKKIVDGIGRLEKAADTMGQASPLQKKPSERKVAATTPRKKRGKAAEDRESGWLSSSAMQSMARDGFISKTADGNAQVFGQQRSDAVKRTNLPNGNPFIQTLPPGKTH